VKKYSYIYIMSCSMLGQKSDAENFFKSLVEVKQV